MRPCVLGPVVTLLTTGLLAEAPKITAHYTDPELADYANASVAVCEEWYPKIAEILYGPGHTGPYAEIRIVFDSEKLAGWTQENTIHLHPRWIKEPHVLDYRAVVIHELAHVVQDYVLRLRRCSGLYTIPCFFQIHFANHGPDWLVEGIADFVTYTYFTGTNKPTLRLDSTGKLMGYTEQIPYLFGLQQEKIPVNAAYRPREVHAGKGYQHGYTVASAFLLWLERRRDEAIVRRLHAAMHKRNYRSDLFRKYCGAPLDRLWTEFLRESMSGSSRDSSAPAHKLRDGAGSVSDSRRGFPFLPN